MMKNLLVAVSVAVCGLAPGVRAVQGINARGVLVAGESVPSLEGLGLDGQAIVFSYKAQRHPTVVYAVSKNGGGFVSKNEANFAALVTGAAGRFSFVVVCPNGDDGSLAAYIGTIQPQWKGQKVTVIASVSEDLRQSMSLFSYPQTIVVSAESKVLANFRGAFGPRETSPFAPIDEVARFFGVRFPGVGR